MIIHGRWRGVNGKRAVVRGKPPGLDFGRAQRAERGKALTGSGGQNVRIGVSNSEAGNGQRVVRFPRLGKPGTRSGVRSRTGQRRVRDSVEDTGREHRPRHGESRKAIIDVGERKAVSKRWLLSHWIAGALWSVNPLRTKSGTGSEAECATSSSSAGSRPS